MASVEKDQVLIKCYLLLLELVYSEITGFSLFIPPYKSKHTHKQQLSKANNHNHDNYHNNSQPTQQHLGNMTGDEANRSLTVYVPKPKFVFLPQLLLARGGVEFMSVNAPLIIAFWESTDLKKDSKKKALIVVGACGVVGYWCFDGARVLMRGRLFKALLFICFWCECCLLFVIMGKVCQGQNMIDAVYMMLPSFIVSLFVMEVTSYLTIA